MRDILLAGGGLFLLVKATKEIHERLEGDATHGPTDPANALFSLDLIITAVGMVDKLWVMMTAMIIAMGMMMIAASKPLTAFVGRHPTVIILCLSFLLLTDVLRETGEHFAVVVDSHGNIDGVVTATDIFAAIAGDLAEDEDEADWKRIDALTIEADATISWRDLAEAIGHFAPGSASRHSSLGGYLLFEFGRMPDVDETIESDGLTFTILSVLASRIDRVRVAHPST